MATAPNSHLVDDNDYRLDAYKRLLVHPILHGEGTDTLVRQGRTVLANANTEYVVLNADVASPRYLHILTCTLTNPSYTATAYVQLTSKPSGAGSTIDDCILKARETKQLTYGWAGLRPTNNEHFAAKSDSPGIIVRADGYAFDE